MLSHEIISVQCQGQGAVLPGVEVGDPNVYLIDNRKNIFTPAQCYQQAFESSEAEVLIYVHDDVEIYDEAWLSRVLDLFVGNPACSVVGLGGAPYLGSPDLYKRRYKLDDMARARYRSNQRDWAVHGVREEGVCPVRVVDAFFMAVRRSLLSKVGGWPVDHLTHHVMDLWVCCEAARQNKEVWVVGADCRHLGGGTSVKQEYKDAKWLQGGTLDLDHQAPHEWLYEEYRDVLPLRIPA